MLRELSNQERKSKSDKTKQDDDITYVVISDDSDDESLDNLEKLYSELHPIFMNYIRYCYSIRFDEEPLYERIKQLFIKSI